MYPVVGLIYFLPTGPNLSSLPFLVLSQCLRIGKLLKLSIFSKMQIDSREIFVLDAHLMFCLNGSLDKSYYIYAVQISCVQ